MHCRYGAGKVSAGANVDGAPLPEDAEEGGKEEEVGEFGFNTLVCSLCPSNLLDPGSFHDDHTKQKLAVAQSSTGSVQGSCWLLLCHVQKVCKGHWLLCDVTYRSQILRQDGEWSSIWANLLTSRCTHCTILCPLAITMMFPL